MLGVEPLVAVYVVCGTGPERVTERRKTDGRRVRERGVEYDTDFTDSADVFQSPPRTESYRCVCRRAVEVCACVCV